MTQRKILTRCLATLALLAVYVVGASAFMVASTSTATARGRGRGRGRRGVYIAPRIYVPPVYVAPVPRCYWSRRWRKTICRY